jgi:putative hydrolase of the HAD superfamily
MPLLPRAILFDLDDTLLVAFGSSESQWQRIIAAHAEELAPLAPAAVLAAIQESSLALWADPARHKYWRHRIEEARRRIVSNAFAGLAAHSRHLPAPALCDAIADRYNALHEAELCMFPDAHETVDGLRAAGVRLALITNGAAAPQRAKVVRFALENRFDHIQIEGEAGFGKPEERAYRHALDALGVAPQEAWMVGDNLEWEVAAPQRLGIHAIWYDGYGRGLPPDPPARPDRIIRALKELLFDPPDG